jgi:hypothetical protein
MFAFLLYDGADAALSGRRGLFAEVLDGDPLGACLHLERSIYLASLLQRMDLMSMAARLGCRVPLLDEDVQTQAPGLLHVARIGWRETKSPLRRAVRERFGPPYPTQRVLDGGRHPTIENLP